MIHLSEILGQPKAIEQINALIAGGRLPHAWMFCGPEGVGRRTTAEALATTLLCHSTVSRDGVSDACGSCPSCRSMRAGTHGDLHVISRQSARYSQDTNVRNRKMQDLSIGVVREFVIDPAWRGAVQSHGKVFILREAETMSNAAQNALLKTLEEPPAGVTLILLTGSPADMLPTTRSRCAVVRFGPLPRAMVAERLTAEGVEEGEARFWAAWTDGSLGRSLRSAGGPLYELKREIIDRLAGLIGDVDAELGEWLAKQADGLADRRVNEDKLLSKTVATRDCASLLLAVTASAYRDAMVLTADGDEAELINADQAGAIRQIASAMGVADCAEVVSQIGRYEELLWRNVNAKVMWDNVVVTCASAAPLEV